MNLLLARSLLNPIERLVVTGVVLREAPLFKNFGIVFTLVFAGGLATSTSGHTGLAWGQEPDSSTTKVDQQHVAENPQKHDPTGTAPASGPKKDSPGPAIDTAARTEATNGFRIGVDDELAISVWHEPEFSQAVVVRPDGIITLPLINDIKVAGLTTDELQAVLTEKLKALVNEPQVTVVVKAIKSRKVFLVGSVGKQGVYPLTGGLTALELIAEGGGLGAFAKTRSIYILHHENGKQVRIHFNYKKALAGKGDNPLLEPGDMLVVP